MSGDVIPGLKNINILRYLAYNKKNFFFFFSERLPIIYEGRSQQKFLSRSMEKKVS